MALGAAVSMPHGRPKLRSKLERRLELPAVYTDRNLDSCTQQLDHWNPFSSSSAANPEPKLGDPVTDVKSNVGLQPEKNPNLGTGRNIAHPIPVSAFRSVPVVSPEDCGPFPVGLQRHPRSEGPRGFDPPPEPFTESSIGWFHHHVAHSGSDIGVFEFGKVSKTPEGDVQVVQGQRVHAWSKRKKQLSHALARGLWRWKNGFHSRKRMKRCGPDGGRNSGSDRSSDRAPYAVHASDPSTAPTSKAGPFKWSDFPVTPTDSSGELFGGGISNLVLAEMHALGKDWTGCGCSRTGNDPIGSSRPTDCNQCWLGSSENPHAMESGYGSEPGYRGDEELEFGDIDEEQDEEEIEPKHLRMWTQVMARSSSSSSSRNYMMVPAPLENHDMHEVNGQATTTFTPPSLQSPST